MKAWWTTVAGRIDAMSQRERLFLFASVLVIVLAVVDTVWLSPLQAAQKQLSLRFQAQAAEVNRLRTELQSSAAPVDANAAARAALQRNAEQLAVLEKDIAALAPQAQGGPDLERVLLQFLRRQQGLVLVSTGTIQQAPAMAKTLPAGMLRQGMELRVAGSYPELVRYVRALETALPSLRWGPMALQADPQGIELTLQVFVVGVSTP